MKRGKLKSGKAMALSQIVLLLIGTIAISYALGSEIGFVSAVSTDPCQGLSSTNPVVNYCFQYGANIYQVTAVNPGVVVDSRGFHYKKSGDLWVWVEGDALNPPNTPLQNIVASGSPAGSTCSGDGGKYCANPSTVQQYFNDLELSAAANFVAASAPDTTNPSSSSSPSQAATTAAQNQCEILLAKKQLTLADMTGCASAIQSGASSLAQIKSFLRGESKGNSNPSTSPTPTSATGASSTADQINAQLKAAGSTKTYQDLLKSCANDPTIASPEKCAQQAAQSIVSDSKSKLPSDNTGSGSLLSLTKLFGGGRAATFFGNIIEGAAIGAAIYYFGNNLLSSAGVPADLSNALSASIGVGWAAGQTAYGLINAIKPGAIGVGGAAAIGGGIALIWFVATYKHITQQVVAFTCIPWQAPTGGDDCSKCGADGLGCSQYQCQSLGLGCQLLNKDQSGKEICVFVNQGDNAVPMMSFIKDYLPSDKFTAEPATAVSPGDTGVKLLYNGGDIPAYTPLTMGIHTDKPARCKMDYQNTGSYDNMSVILDSGLYEYNHTIQLSVQSLNQSDSSSLQIAPNGKMNLYVRCRDANNNTDVQNFVITFNVQKGPDTQPPVIEGTDIANNMPVAYGTESTKISLYTNEPAICKWDHQDSIYDNLANPMNCDYSKVNPQGYYTCTATLDGIKNRQANDFYFRCADQPDKIASERNVDQESYHLTLMGTEPLVINYATPNNTLIKDNTQRVRVTLRVNTSAGYSAGKASCFYNPNPSNLSGYILFTNTNSYTSTTDLWLPSGSYNYSIKCVDLGGNADYTNINFRVETDYSAPQIVRVYHDTIANYLNIITDENATCVYDVVGCDYPFDQGISMTDVDGTTHTAPWQTNNNYYIKCKDVFGNQPDPSSCTMTVRPLEF